MSILKKINPYSVGPYVKICIIINTAIFKTSSSISCIAANQERMGCSGHLGRPFIITCSLMVVDVVGVLLLLSLMLLSSSSSCFFFLLLYCCYRHRRHRRNCRCHSDQQQQQRYQHNNNNNKKNTNTNAAYNDITTLFVRWFSIN